MADGLRLRFSLAGAVAAMALVAFPALASAATISGTVTAASGGAPLDGVQVCADQQNFELQSWCTTTDAAGGYSLSVAAGRYSVHFDDTVRNRNVVSQYYGNPIYPGTLIELPGAGDTLTGIDAQLQPGSTIAGTVTDAVTHTGIAGIPVCAEYQLLAQGPVGRCESSGPGGVYVINGLPAGSYNVTFHSGDQNYQSQRYKEKDPLGPGTPVEILGPGELKTGIDAALQVGVEISGRLTEAGTGVPAARVNVELLWVGSERSTNRFTDADGRFVFRGQPEADYVLRFSRPEGPLGADLDCFAQQYYLGSDTPSGATVLHGVPGLPITGLDAALQGICPPPPPPLQVTFAPSSSTQVGAVGKPVRCRKGTHRKRVKGKVRCVKRRQHQKRHRGHKGHHGPTAHVGAR